MVAIAQLVEPRIVIPVVVGSNPISHPIICFMQFERVVGIGRLALVFLLCRVSSSLFSTKI